MSSVEWAIGPHCYRSHNDLDEILGKTSAVSATAELLLRVDMHNHAVGTHPENSKIPLAPAISRRKARNDKAYKGCEGDCQVNRVEVAKATLFRHQVPLRSGSPIQSNGLRYPFGFASRHLSASNNLWRRLHKESVASPLRCQRSSTILDTEAEDSLWLQPILA